MDVYHQVLVKIYQASEGKPNKTVNLMDLVRTIGLHGNYTDILEHLNVAGWIAEAPKADWVSITPWGVREARKSLENSGNIHDSKQEIIRASNRAVHLAKELTVLFEAQAQDPTQDFAEASKKMIELQSAVAQIKTALS